MENALLKKLQLKKNFKVKLINEPNNLDEVIGSTAEISRLATNSSIEIDALLVFAVSKADFDQALELYATEVKPKTICWIFYPKAKSVLASDLNLMQNWDYMTKYSLTPCGSAAINDIWTAIRVKPESEMKRSGLGNAEIAKSGLGKYIDVANKIITLPDDLANELSENQQALNFYNSLSYSNRKEYVLWVISAKQEKTRLDRIQKTAEKLTLGKKNPSDK
ncbi:MAG: hypothetical protein EOO42_16330 [Flavobacteriales bacterium]|nr:MAG: hypothetical protein EOO42_16330 [Flavobacteriales bacterium]